MLEFSRSYPLNSSGDLSENARNPDVKTPTSITLDQQPRLGSRRFLGQLEVITFILHLGKLRSSEEAE